MIQPTWQRRTVIWLIKCPILVKIQNFREQFYFTLRYVFSDIPRQDSDENVSLKYTTQGPESKSCMKEAYSLGGQHQGPALPASHYRDPSQSSSPLPGLGISHPDVPASTKLPPPRPPWAIPRPHPLSTNIYSMLTGCLRSVSFPLPQPVCWQFWGTSSPRSWFMQHRV